MNIEELKSLCTNCKTAEDIVKTMSNYKNKNFFYDNKDNIFKMLHYFDVIKTDEIITRELGRFTIYAEPTENSNELRDEKGNLIAREEKELLVTVWENFTDSGSDDYLYTFAVWTDGERY